MRRERETAKDQGASGLLAFLGRSYYSVKGTVYRSTQKCVALNVRFHMRNAFR